MKWEKWKKTLICFYLKNYINIKFKEKLSNSTAKTNENKSKRVYITNKISSKINPKIIIL
jgi:hypothetical protein